MWHGAISSLGAIGGVLEHIPDGLDPVLPLGALIVAVLALCPVKFAMGRHGPRRRAALARENAIRAKLSPTELSALETALATPQQLSGDASTCWGHKRPRTCLGRSAQQQLALDQEQLQRAQHKLALDQEQLQRAQHQLAVDQQQLQNAQHQLGLNQQQLQVAQHQLAVDQQLLQDARRQVALDQQQLQGAQHQLAVNQQQLQGAQHHLAQDLEQLQGTQHQLAQALEQMQNGRTGLERSEILLRQHMDACMRAPAMDLPSHADMQTCRHATMQPCSHAAMQPEMRHICFMRNCVPIAAAQAAYSAALPPDKCMKLKPGVDGSIMLSVKQYAPVKQKEGPARIELQQFKLSLREVVDKLNEQMPSYIWHHFVAHHQLAVFRRQQQAVQEKGDHGRVVISCDWSERLTVERPTEIQSDHWHHHNVGIFVACAYFRNDRDEYREETVYILTDGKDQSAAVTQAALHQVLDYLQGERCMVMKQLCMWSDGCAAQFKGTPALQLHRRMAMRYRVSVWWSYGATSHFKGRHDSEGGVFKHSMAARVLADHPDLSAECKAQQLAGVHNVECVVPAAQLAASVAHQTRGSVQRRWCLVLKDEEVEKCAELDPDAHRLLRTITGSRAMHAMFFPADGVAPMWSETACACVRHMGSKPQQCTCHGASTLSSIPMFGRVTLASDKKEDAECLELLHARAPHIASAHMTLNVHLLKEYARECLGWKGKRLTQKKPLLRADILEHLRWEQEMEEDQLAEVGVDEADDILVPEDPDSDIVDRDEALQPDLTEADRNRKVSGEARAARDRDNTYHGRKCKLAHLIDHLPQELWDAFLDDAVQPRVEAISERAVLASLLFGLLVRGLFAIHVADPLGLHDQPVYTDIPVSQAAIPDLSCRNLFLQLVRGLPGNGAHTRPNAAVAAVLAAHPDLRDRLAAIPRHPSDTNMVDHVGKQLETAFSNMLTLLFAGRLKKSVSLAGAKVLVGTEEHRRRFGFWGVGGGYLPAWSKRECTYVRRMVCGLDVTWLLEQGKALVECANAVASNKGQPGSVVGYEEIAEASFGPLGKALVSAIIYVELFGTCCLLFILEVLYTLVTGNFTAGALTHSALPATLPLVFGIMTFCYSGHGVFPAIQASMKEPQLFPKVLNVAFFLVAFLCTFIAAAGYYMYGAGAADIVIFNLPTLLATACSCLVLINPVAKFALTMEPVAAAANVAAGAGRPLTGLPRLAVRTALSLAILMAARSLPFLAHLMALVGSFMTISVSVTLPALCHLILLKGKLGTAKVLWNWFVVLLGVTCTVAGTTASMRSLAAKASAVAEEATRKALLVKKLERQADDEHKQAQRFNKAGRFEEAQAAYSRMHQLEDEATALAKEIGCVACILGDPSCAANTSPLSQEEQDAYFVLHPPAPWPSNVASLPHTVQAALQHASGGNSLIPGSVESNGPSHCLPLTVEVLADRARGSVLGSLVADAAAMGVHWVYDLNLMQQLERETVMARSLSRSMASMNLDLAPASASGSDPASVGLSQANLHSLSSISLVDAGGVSSGGLLEQDSWHSTTSCDEGLEFLNPPRSPFYAYASGRNSPYGEQTLVLLRSLAARQGLDCCSYALAFQDYFGDKFDGYRDVSTKGFLRAFARGQVPPATGAPDAQANCIARLAPLVAAWAGSAGLVPAVRRATRVTQNSDEACSWGAAGAAILEAVLLGALPSAAVQAVAEELEWGTVAAAAAAAVPKGVEDGETGTAPGAVDTPAEESPHIASSGASSRLEVTHELAGVIAGNLRHAMKLAALPPSTAIAELGRNCHMPNALTSPLQIVLHMEHRARCSITPSAPGSAAVAAVAGAMQTMYAEAVRLAIREGGCCASRSAYVGAVMGALAGVAGVPPAWQAAYSQSTAVSEAAGVLCRARSQLTSLGRCAASICEQYPSLEESGAIDLLIPKKEPLLLGKCEGHVQIAILNNVPLFFQERDGHWCPTLRVLHQYPEMMKKLRADKGAIKFVLSGANIMCPGLTSPGATLHDEVSTLTPCHSSAPDLALLLAWTGSLYMLLLHGRKLTETPVAIYAEGKEHAMAIGYTKMSTADMKTINKGIAVSRTSSSISSVTTIFATSHHACPFAV
ncbi:hypothetical protein QJQ45_009406 [Haematococcus lacustris]|nr:hypothetical protein QJQ45_009406 [Haematococcus lacustris]